jgi:hypothetical protein
MNPQSSREARPRQTVAVEIRNDLLGVIRNQFYADAAPGQFQKDRNFLLTQVVLWPAGYLDKRGVTLPPQRYKAILLDVFNGIKAHGQTGAIKYWPGYLMHCVQTHFRVHGEEYYNEGKALRATLDKIIRKAPAIPTADPIRVMAEARNDLLKSSRTRPKHKSEAQIPLLQLACNALPFALFFGSNLCATAILTA